MASFFNKLGVKISLILTITFVLLVSLFILYLNKVLEKDIKADIDHQLKENLNVAVSIVDIFHFEVVKHTNTLFNVLQQEFGTFEIDTSNLSEFNNYQVPTMMVDKHPINMDFSKVDKFTKATKATATVFVKIGDEFLRVSTSLRKKNGERAINTFLNKNSDAYKSIMQKKRYLGENILFGKNYMTIYDPIFDNNQELIGILYMGFDFTEGLSALNKSLSSVKIAQTGYHWIVDNKRQVYELHPTRSGKSISISANAIEISNRKNGTKEYDYEGVTKVSIFKHYKPFDWT